jgi:chromosome segregation ATPase
MRRWILFAQTLVLLPAPALCQTTSTDSQTLQALLAEVRQLRQELRITSVAAQRAQILIYRVQAQQTVVTRLTQRVDNDRSRLTQNQSEQKRLTSVIKRLEEQRDTQSDTERKRTEEQLAQMKIRLEQLNAEEQESQPRKIELEEELRLEQTKLTQLQEELDRIDKTLEQASRGLGSAPQ